MSFYDYFKRFMGLPPRYPPHDEHIHHFRSPLWGDEEEEDQEDEFRNTPSTPFGFNIFTGDVMDMHRYFEQQFDEMLKNFKAMDGNMFGSGLLELPEGVRPSEEGGGGEERIRDRYLKPSYERGPQHDRKPDSDIDGRVSARDLESMFPGESSIGHEVPRRAFSRSVTKSIVTLPGGRVEERKTVRGSDGEESTTVTRRLGDQSHSLTTVRATDGSSETHEELLNLDQGELHEFEKKWGSERRSSTPAALNPNQGISGRSLLAIIDKLFKQ